MGSFTPRVAEIIISAFTLLAAWSIGFAASSVYFVRPGEIRNLVYWLLLAHIPTMVYFILYIIRPTAIIDAENRLKKVLIENLLKDKEFKKSHIVGKSEVSRAAGFHLVTVIFAIMMGIASLASLITRVILYAVSDIDLTTLDTTRVSFILIFVDTGVLISAAIIVVAIFFNTKKYHGQKLLLIKAAAISNQASLINGDSSSSAAGARLMR
jgi:hypothetical protein